MAANQQSKKLILLLLVFAMARKKVILSPIGVAVYARILVPAECLRVGEVLQLHRAERNVIRARRQEIRLL